MYRGCKRTEEFKGIPAHWDKSALPDLGFKVWRFLFHLFISFLYAGLLCHSALVDDCFICNITQRY